MSDILSISLSEWFKLKHTEIFNASRIVVDGIIVKDRFAVMTPEESDHRKWLWDSRGIGCRMRNIQFMNLRIFSESYAREL